MSAPAALRAPVARQRGVESRRTKEEARNGLPVEPDLTEPLPKRLLRSRLAWVTAIMLIVYAVCLVLLYRQVVPDQQVPGGVLPGLGRDAVPIAAKYAAITAVPLSLLFLWADRFRPQRFWVWLMTFGWGACVATYVAADINTWAAAHLSIVGDGDPATGPRAAIFVAPFVEEASKATVLFWLAILMRYAWVSPLSGIVLAGLSGAAFAFVENILYYGRAYRYAARTFGAVSPEDALHQTFVVRGLFTFFGHPLFTAMTGIGLAVAMRSKSKTVRVVAPLAGFCAAALLHMSFNTAASLLSERQQLLVLLFVAVPLVLGLIGFVVRQVFREGRRIRTRLGDYVRVGWLEADDPKPLSRLRTRGAGPWHALFTGPATFLATIRLQRVVTELAYLRYSMDRGLVDADRPGPRTGPAQPAQGRCDHRPSSTRSVARPTPGSGSAGGATVRPVAGVPAACLPRTGRSGRQLPGARCANRRAGPVGADCYPVLGGRPHLEAPGRAVALKEVAAVPDDVVDAASRSLAVAGPTAGSLAPPRERTPLETALVRLHGVVTDARLPLPLPGAAAAQAAAGQIGFQLDDYVMPRLASIDAPMLTVRQNTPVDALFALDPHYETLPDEDYHGFRALAERSALADYEKDGGMAARVPRLAPRWLSEVTALNGWRHFQPADFTRLKNDFGVTWIVLSRDDVLFSAPPSDALACPYSNEQLRVCRLY